MHQIQVGNAPFKSRSFVSFTFIYLDDFYFLDNKAGRYRHRAEAWQASPPHHEDHGLRSGFDEEEVEHYRDGPRASMSSTIVDGSTEVDEPIAILEHAPQLLEGESRSTTDLLKYLCKEFVGIFTTDV